MLSDISRQLLPAARLLLVLTLVTGLVYPAAVWGVGRLLPDAADGSLVRAEGRDVGSRLLGQGFTGDQWFQSRPSSGGWDGLASGPSNLGPSTPELLDLIETRRSTVAEQDGVDPVDVPPDALTASASGLDPYISPEYADQQVERVARVRGLGAEQVRVLAEQATAGRQLGFLGQPRVNVLLLNRSLLGAD